MSSRINPGGLLAEYHALPGGPRVCLRLVRRRDAAGLRALYARHGTPLSELELARLVTLDLGTQLVLCATALIDSAETAVGVGAIELEDGGRLAPSLVVVDEELADGLDALLVEALVAHADAMLRARAA
jgi:hypothetical protein